MGQEPDRRDGGRLFTRLNLSMSGPCFVYTLNDGDVVFYVGASGQSPEQRWYEYKSYANNPAVPQYEFAVCRRLRALWQCGKCPTLVVIQSNLSENEAVLLEQKMIDYYGLDTLCNCRRAFKTKKRVLCRETGMIYSSISEAARDTGMCISTIARRLNGQPVRKAGTFHFEELD